MNLILGAVQFGVNYGVANKSGQPSRDVAFSTLDAAWDCGIRTLDSAQGYGQANQVIADYHMAGGHKFSVINKVMRFPAEVSALMDSLVRERDASGIDKFDCIMFHYAPSVGIDFPDMFLDDLKSCGLADRVGLSIETPMHYNSLKDRFSFDVVQLPLNILSQNFMVDEFLNELKNNHVEIHARSAFLQGLLLGPIADIPPHLSPLTDKIWKYQNDCRALNISFLTGCLMFLLQKLQIDHIVVGAQNPEQLYEIANAYKMAEVALAQEKIMDWQSYASNDFQMIHPSSWAELAKKLQGSKA